MMETLDYDYALHNNDEGDKKLAVVFYNHFLKNEGKSAAEGRQVFDDTVFIKIFTPGDRNQVVDRPLRPTDQFRFPNQWARFKQNEEQRGSGTPLTEWPIISRSQAEELKYLGFTTVEQVAEAKDGIHYMGLQILKAKAKAFIELAKGNTAPMEEMSKELEEMKAQNRVLTDSVKELGAQLKAVQQSLAAKTK